MKNLIPIILLFIGFVASSVHGQGIRGEALGYFTYVQPPSDPALTQYETYKVISRYDVEQRIMDKIEGAIDLAGFEKIERDMEADFIVEIEYYPLKFGDRERETKDKTYNKDGVKKTERYYYYTTKADYKYKLRVYIDKSNILYSDEISGSKTLKTDEYKSSGDAYKAINEERSKAKGALVSGKVRDFNSELNEKFCSLDKNVQIRSANIKPKKNNSYEDYDSYLAEMKKGFELVTGEEKSVVEAKPHFQKAIAGFEEMLKESNLDKRKARVNEKVTALLYGNIGHIYFMMDDYDQAIEYYTKGQQLKGWIAGIDSMISLAKSQKERIEAGKS